MQRQTSETMSVVRKKLDDKYLKVLRELVSVTGGGNRQCFDCGQKGPTYVNMTIGSFVCTRCSGVLRGLTPPHRVKSISMATFTPVEIEFLKLHGNDSCAKTWLGLWDPKRAVYQDHRELMIDKYERKRYYLEPASPLKSLSNAPILKSSVSQMPSSVSALQSITTLNNNNNNNVNNANNLKVSTTYINTKSAKSFNNDINYFDNNLNGNSQTSPKHIKQNTVLTPPTGKRTNNNGLETCSSEINEPEQMEYYQSFSYHSGPPLPPSMTSTRSGNPFISANHDHTGNKGLKGSGIQNNKNGLNALESSLIRSNSETNKSFHFVADFKSANIFDATLSAVSLNESSTSLNNYTRSQSITSPRSTHESFSPINENLRNKEIITTNVKNGNSENFADFEHAPIFNAIEQQRSNNTNNNSIVLSNLTYNSKSQTVDRYAALKDLDEQLRESKTVAGAAVATSVVDSFLKGNTNSSNVNPFKFVPSSQQQVQHTANPFQANSNHTISTCCTKGISSIGISNVFASIQSQKNGCGDADGFRISGEENRQAYLDYGKVYASTTISHPPNLSTTMFSSNDSNSCGFGFTSIQPESTGSPSTAFNNPFVTTSSNNPFL